MHKQACGRSQTLPLSACHWLWIDGGGGALISWSSFSLLSVGWGGYLPCFAKTFVESDSYLEFHSLHSHYCCRTSYRYLWAVPSLGIETLRRARVLDEARGSWDDCADFVLVQCKLLLWRLTVIWILFIHRRKNAGTTWGGRATRHFVTVKLLSASTGRGHFHIEDI